MQLQSLSDTLEGIICSHNVPFKLTGKAFQFLEQMFLFYDLSVDGFLQAYKVSSQTIQYFPIVCTKLDSLTFKRLRSPISIWLEN